MAMPTGRGRVSSGCANLWCRGPGGSSSRSGWKVCSIACWVGLHLLDGPSGYPETAGFNSRASIFYPAWRVGIWIDAIALLPHILDWRFGCMETKEADKVRPRFCQRTPPWCCLARRPDSISHYSLQSALISGVLTLISRPRLPDPIGVSACSF